MTPLRKDLKVFHVVYCNELVRSVFATNLKEAIKEAGHCYGQYAIVHDHHLRAYLK